MQLYSGYISNERKLLASASGGAATALAECVLAKNGVVYGVRYSNDFRYAEFCCVDNLSDLEQIKGSKYVETRKNGLYDSVATTLAENKTVLFLGLGCDIGAIKSYCKNKFIDTTHLYTVDILCHGPVPKEVHERYILELENKYKSKLSDFSIRYKKNGWYPFYIKAIFENGLEHIEPFNESDYGKAFYYISRPICTNCAFKGEKHQGDLCVGDYWGIKENMPGWNPNGVSIIVVQTKKGEELLSQLRDDFVIQHADKDVFLQNNPMYEHSRRQYEFYSEFMNDLKSQGLHYAVKKLPVQRVSTFAKVFRKIKNYLSKFLKKHR